MSQVDLKKGPPPIPPDLVEYLEAVYPDRFPVIEGADAQLITRDLYRSAGRLDVVRFLRDHLVRQSKPQSPIAKAQS